MCGWSERVMGQTGFFDVERRLEAISAKGDPLETIKKIVRWEDLRADIESVTETKPEERKSNAGRKPYDAILKFKIVVLQSLHNLSDEQTEYLIRDRLSFMRFLDLDLEDPVPDARTIWLFREALAQAGLIDKLFERFGQHLETEGYIARGGQIIDATIVSVPKQRHTKEENEAIKAGKRGSARHYQTIWLLAQGHTIAAVSALTSFVPRWIEELLARYNALGPRALGDLRRHNGAPRGVPKPGFWKQLKVRLEQPPPDGGVWTSRKVADFMA